MSLTAQTKTAITQAVSDYVEAHSLTQLEKLSKVSRKYLKHIQAGEYQYENQHVDAQTQKMKTRMVNISDAPFKKLARLFDIELQYAGNEAVKAAPESLDFHWKTKSFKMISARCRMAQRDAKRVLIDGFSGAGKSYALQHYAENHSKVIYVRASSDMKAGHLLEEILKALGEQFFARGNRGKINQLEMLLTHEKGWLLIIDEAEDIQLPIYKVIKAIADFTQGECGFVLCGIGIKALFERKNRLQKTPFMQLRRRFFGNRLEFPKMLKDEIVSICKAHGITKNSAIIWFQKEVEDFDMMVNYVRDILKMCQLNHIQPEQLTSKVLQEFFYGNN